jgi:hypothetical protein
MRLTCVVCGRGFGVSLGSICRESSCVDEDTVGTSCDAQSGEGRLRTPILPLIKRTSCFTSCAAYGSGANRMGVASSSPVYTYNSSVQQILDPVGVGDAAVAFPLERPAHRPGGCLELQHAAGAAAATSGQPRRQAGHASHASRLWWEFLLPAADSSSRESVQVL